MTTEQDAKSKVHLRLLGRSIGLPSEAREVIEIVWKAAAEFFQAQQPMPAWMQYDPATDVLTIHGRKYSAALFGRDGFLGDPGDLLRIEKGGDDTVTLTRIPVEHPAQPVATDVGNLEYMGNSVSFIYQKMRAYKDGMGKVWQALRDNGIHPDGQTHAADAIRKALAQPAQPVRQYHCPETETLCSKCESHCEAAQPVQLVVMCEGEKDKQAIAGMLSQPVQPVEPVAHSEPIYQLKEVSGLWRDQSKDSHEYNVANGYANMTRIVYTHPPAEVVRELVGALKKAEDAITFEIGGESCGLQTALIAVRTALAKAKEHGL